MFLFDFKHLPARMIELKQLRHKVCYDAGSKAEHYLFWKGCRDSMLAYVTISTMFLSFRLIFCPI